MTADLLNVRKQVTFFIDPFHSAFITRLTAHFLWSIPLQSHQHLDPCHLRSSHHVVGESIPSSQKPSIFFNRSFQVAAYDLPRPTFLPQIQYHINDYLKFDVTYGTLQGFVWLAYYYLLEPTAAVRFTQDPLSRRSHSVVTAPLYPSSHFVCPNCKRVCSESRPFKYCACCTRGMLDCSVHRTWRL
jgi:hypothetical protein